MAEDEALADVDLLQPQLLVQELAHELARRHPRELGGEADDEQDRDPGLPEQRLLLLRRGQRHRRALGVEHGQRVGIEGDDHRRHPQLAGALDGAVEDRPLAAVDAVEVADGGDAAVRQIAAVESVLDDVHGEG